MRNTRSGAMIAFPDVCKVRVEDFVINSQTQGAISISDDVFARLMNASGSGRDRGSFTTTVPSTQVGLLLPAIQKVRDAAARSSDGIRLYLTSRGGRSSMALKVTLENVRNMQISSGAAGGTVGTAYALTVGAAQSVTLKLDYEGLKSELVPAAIVDKEEKITISGGRTE